MPRPPTRPRRKLLTILKVLDAALQGLEYLGRRKIQRVADINVACVIGLAVFAKVDLSSVPNVKAWFERCNSRPARGM